MAAVFGLICKELLHNGNKIGSALVGHSVITECYEDMNFESPYHNWPNGLQASFNQSQIFTPVTA